MYTCVSMIFIVCVCRSRPRWLPFGVGTKFKKFNICIAYWRVMIRLILSMSTESFHKLIFVCTCPQRHLRQWKSVCWRESLGPRSKVMAFLLRTCMCTSSKWHICASASAYTFKGLCAHMITHTICTHSQSKEKWYWMKLNCSKNGRMLSRLHGLHHHWVSWQKEWVLLLAASWIISSWSHWTRAECRSIPKRRNTHGSVTK